MQFAAQIVSVLSTTTKSFTAKAVGGGFLAIYAFLFSFESWQLMAALIVLVTFDMVTGIFAAKKTGEEIKSSKAARTAVKLAMYGLLISSGHLTDSIIGIPEGWFNIETALLGFLAATELISILENSGRMGFGVPRKILNQLHRYTDK